MAGLHFSCGKWMGEDKSADPLFDIIPEILSDYVESEEWFAWLEFQAKFTEQAQSEEPQLLPSMMASIVEPLTRYRDALIQKLGLSAPEASLDERGPFPRTLTPDERRLECVRDLLVGNKICQQTGEPISVYFV